MMKLSPQFYFRQGQFASFILTAFWQRRPAMLRPLKSMPGN
jgi:hypothetical protein